MTLQHVGDALFGKDLYELQDDHLAFGGKSATWRQNLDFLWSVRDQITHLAKHHFQAPHLYPEYSQLTKRLPGTRDYSHGLHADSCNWDEETRECYNMPQHCCEWRTYSALLYLNEQGISGSQGGSFVFSNRSSDGCAPSGKNLLIPTKCGRVVVFSSGPENIHGVEQVYKGARYAFALWFTGDEGRREPDRSEWTAQLQAREEEEKQG